MIGNAFESMSAVITAHWVLLPRPAATGTRTCCSEVVGVVERVKRENIAPCESGGLESMRPNEARRTCNENSCHLMNLLRSQWALGCSCDGLGTMSASVDGLGLHLADLRKRYQLSLA